MKNFIKTIKVIIPLVAIVFVLCSCGNDTNNYDQEQTNNQSSTYDNNYEVQTTTTAVDSNKVDISEIADVKFLNFNGYGFVHVENHVFVLEDVISKETMKNFVTSAAPQLAFEIYGQGDECYFGEIINYEPENNNNRLRNGDTVNVVAKVTDEFAAYGVTVDAVKQGLGIDFDTVKSYTVSGLLEGFNPIDVMNGIEQYVIFEGTNGNISARVELPSNYTLDVCGFHIEAVNSSFNSNTMMLTTASGSYFYFAYEINDSSLKSGDTALIELKSAGKNYDLDLIELFAAEGGFFTDLTKEIVVPAM